MKENSRFLIFKCAIGLVLYYIMVKLIIYRGIITKIMDYFLHIAKVFMCILYGVVGERIINVISSSFVILLNRVL